MPSTGEIAHLLRRTEFFAEPARVAALAALPSREAAVDAVMAIDVSAPGIDPDPPPAVYDPGEHAQRIARVTRRWVGSMVGSNQRMQEKMALFWHGHFVSDDAKAGYTATIAAQLDLYRRRGLGNFRELAIDMSTTVAMLRYLDNNQNFASAPNQNFGRELLELFLLGVGNYTEADVEASTAAWTGHGEDNHHTNGQYVWRPDRHDATPRPFLGGTTCANPEPREHGADVIRGVLSNGVATAGPQSGRATREIAADFISTKWWRYFAGTEIPGPVRDHLRSVALANDFEIRPWLKALLTHDAFYADDVVRGLVRAPTDFVVALLATTSVPADPGFPYWLGEGMGQRLLFPPNVAGWGHNATFVNASAFAQRAAAARHVAYYVLFDYWEGAGMRLRNGQLTRSEVFSIAGRAGGRQALVRRIVELMGLTLSATTLTALDEFAANAALAELHDLVELIYVSPELSVA